ncbi:translation initiation factor 2 (IF-2, GTPase) [Pseudomonas aeruginosa]|nr:translation initiation factor 2 (IF-2, GTPase) [Pseudomonas aeruginosa]
MRPSTAHCLLLSLSLGASLAQAEEPAPAPIPAAQPSIAQATAELERRLVETERQRDELVSRMRQENRQLREQLQAAQAQRQPPLLTEEQTWYVAGAAPPARVRPRRPEPRPPATATRMDQLSDTDERTAVDRR